MKMEVENTTERDMEIFNDIITHVRRRINNTNRDFIVNGFEKEREEVWELIRRSVEDNESNSAILCGAPGCGKTALVNNVLRDLTSEGILTPENSVTIRLSGFIHTDDRLTLKDIARQLKLSNFSEEAAKSKTFQENLVFLLEELDRKGNKRPCVVFILDDFHLFTEHKNQLLLYNLFDIAQSAKSPICVLGLTSYVDVLDLLEKRVLSRFSNRVIHMVKVPSLEDRLATFKSIFTLSSSDLPSVDDIYTNVWNAKTDELVENSAVRNALQQHLSIDASEARFRKLLFQVFNKITFDEPLMTVQNVTDVFGVKDEQVELLSRLSALELALVVAIKHYSVNYEQQPFNFEMILIQYMKFVKNHASTMVGERAVVMKAYQRLQELEIIVPVKRIVSSTATRVPLEYQLYQLNLTEQQILQGVKLNSGVSADLAQWVILSSLS